MRHIPTKTEIAQKGVSTTIAMTVAKILRDRLAEHTSVNTDGVPVKVGTMVVGQLVAQSLAPYTDKAVDNASLKFQTWRVKRQQKKNAKNNEK
jgi:hypothetical protein